MAGFFAIVTGVVVFLYKGSEQAEAWLHDFNAGNIISDFVMTNKNSMTEAQIQQFLKSKVNCNDTNLSKVSRDNNGYYLINKGVRLNYNIQNGHFVCMADEKFDGESASHIIWQAAQDYGINPQVLIVLLQKEQGLINDSWPNHIQYRGATGYGCPDNADCNADYYGFKNQVRNAARLFRGHIDGKTTAYGYPGGWSGRKVGEPVYIQWNPNSACGGSYITFENRATEALYAYTPYRPNQAALNAGGGTGNSCSAYGNRDFYNLFTEWFGSTQKYDTPIPSGTYTLTSMVGTNKALDVDSAKTINGTNIQLWEKDETVAQDFILEYDSSGYYTITNPNSNKRIDVNGAKTANGTNIQLWEKNNTCAQKWIIKDAGNGYYEFLSACNPSKAIDVNGAKTANGTNIQLWDKNSTNAQKWKIVVSAPIPSGTYTLTSMVGTNKALDVDSAKTINGTNIQLWEKNETVAQDFILEYDSSGYYTITNPNSNKRIDVNGAKTANGTNIQLWEKNNTCAQKWIIKDAGNGYYEFLSACNPSKAIDVNGAKTANGTNIQLWDKNSTNAQKWKINLKLIK